MHYFLLSIALSFISHVLLGQIYGSPFIENYNAKDYNASVSNFDIDQDKDGRMYFANWNGLLRYDGSDWKKINIAEGKSAYELAVSDNDIIYVSSLNQVGYIAIDETGGEYFQPLSSALDSLDIEEVQEIIAVGEDVYFLTIKHLIKYSHSNGVKLLGQKGDIIYRGSEPIAENVFSFRDQLIINIPGTGLCLLSEERLKLIPQGNLLDKEMIVSTTRVKEGQLILCLSGNTYLFDGALHKFQIFNDRLRREIASHQPKCIVARDVGGHTAYVVGTFKNGIYYVMDGKAVFNINQLNGLTNNEVRDLRFAGNSLWVSTQNGISKLTGIDSFMFWNTENEDIGLIWELFKHDGTLYIATTKGLYRKVGNVLKKVGESAERSFFLYEIDNQLYLNNQLGINRVNKNHIDLLYGIEGANRALEVGNQLFVMSNEGLKVLDIVKNELRSPRSVSKEVAGQSFGSEYFNGSAWFSVVNGGLLKIQSEDGKLQVANFTSRHGLPDDTSMEVILFDNDLFFATNDGFYEMNKSPREDSSNLFVRNTSYIDDKSEISYPVTDIEGNLWYVFSANDASDRLEKLQKKGQGYNRISNPFRLLNDQALTIIYPDPDDQNVVWVAGSRGLYRYNGKSNTEDNETFQTLISKVTSGDSVLFHGIYESLDGAKVTDQPTDFVPSVAYANNHVAFEFTATTYDAPDLTQYSYILEGFDQSWSTWSGTDKKEYTNLDPGKYTFKIKARDLYGLESTGTSYSVIIKPPWYYQTWAILIFIVIAAVFVWVIIIVYTFRLRMQKQKLESEVERKTSKVQEQTIELKRHRDEILIRKDELEEKQEEIETQNETLQQLNSTKDKFFSIIGHDLKNPLHSLISFSNLLANHVEHMTRDEIQVLAKDLDKSLKNSYSLLDNLLEWSRSQTNQIEYRPEKFDLGELMSKNKELLEGQAKGKNITIDVKNISSCEVVADKNSINTIIRNLLSNAIKFTPERGKVQLSVAQEDREVVVSVVDNGVGMSPEVEGKIFRIDTKHVTTGTAKEKGTGLGLILCKEFIEKCNGRIWVESEEGKGTTFSFSLPL